MLSNIICAVAVISLTTLVGLAITPKKLGRLTRLALAYSLGFTILSLAGLLAAALDANIFVVQLSALILSCGCYLSAKEKHQRITKEEKTMLLVCSIYVLLFLYLLSRIPTWMAGDTLQRAIEVRMFLDGIDIPVSVFPFGSYFAQYPKAFQAYTFFWVKLLGIKITEALKIVPVILSLYAPLGLYAIVSELGGTRELALYALVIACFGFIPHAAFLVWGGFTTLAGEMLFVTVLLAYNVEKRVLPLLLMGLLFSHPRSLLFTVLVLGAWISTGRMWNRRISGVLILVLLAVVVLFVGSLVYEVKFTLEKPFRIQELVKEKTFSWVYSLTWFLSLMALMGFVLAVKRGDELGLLLVSWILALSVLAIVVDLGVLSTHRMSLDRILTELYLPLSALGGCVFCLIEEGFRGRIKQIQQFMVIATVFCGALTSAVFIRSYYQSWGLPESDYIAFKWLGTQIYKNSVLVNLDSTGMWAYPIAGIELVDPFMFTYNPPDFVKNNAYRPNSDVALGYLNKLSNGHDHVLIYTSNVSSTRPNYKPPFERFYGFYLSVNTSAFDEGSYKRLYARDGVLILEYVGG